MAVNWQGGDDYSFGPSFWEALRRLRSSPDHYYMGDFASWVPTDDVWDYREYTRDSGLPILGSYDENISAVDDIKKSLHRQGQREPVILMYDAPKGDMHLGEGNHRAAAARQLGSPHILARFYEASRRPNKDTVVPGVRRATYTGKGDGLTPKERKEQGKYYNRHMGPDDFEEFKGKGMRPDGKKGAPADRAIVQAMGNKDAAKRILKSMTSAGKVLGPAAGAVGLVAGLMDPLEAMGATVDKAEGNRWANKQKTAKDKAKEKKYYADKQAKAEKVNPMAKYGKHGSARKGKKEK